jgi:hypothetical protein
LTADSNGSQTFRKRKSEHRLVVPTAGATLDNLNSDAVCLSILLPSMVHHISTTLVAWHFSQQVLASLNPGNMELLVEALSAPCAGEPVNYQRLEFIGDSILKFLVSLQLFLVHPHWHEGYLTLVRKSWVCNKTLAHVACERALGAYVITAPFSPRRWKPSYLDDFDDRTDTSERTVSMKLLADVVEAVIGNLCGWWHLSCRRVYDNISSSGGEIYIWWPAQFTYRLLSGVGDGCGRTRDPWRVGVQLMSTGRAGPAGPQGRACRATFLERPCQARAALYTCSALAGRPC